MSKARLDVNEILLECHRRGQETARDISIRTGVPLVIARNGKISYVQPKFKYVLVPIDSKKNKFK